MLSLQFKDVFDLKDDDQLKDLVSRVAARIVILSKGSVDEITANPIALQMLMGYMQHLYMRICNENNLIIDSDFKTDEADFLAIHKETKH